MDFSDIDKRINENTDLRKAFPEIYDFNYLSNEDYEEMLNLIAMFWNNYPREEFNGMSPSERDEMGSQEKMLLMTCMNEAMSKFFPEDYPSTVDAEMAIEAFKQEWLCKPQKELNGKTPKEVIFEERVNLGNPSKDITVQFKLEKISSSEGDKEEELYFEAISARKSGNIEESIRILKELIKISPENYQAWGNMGASYFTLGKKDDALRCLRKSLSINPEYELALNNLKSIESFE